VLAGEGERDRDRVVVLLAQQVEEEAGEAGDAERRQTFRRLGEEELQLLECARCVQRGLLVGVLNAVAAYAEVERVGRNGACAIARAQ
jgi:hypothetical protein